MRIRNSKILITGGAGFIGSNLCEYFLQRGNNVVCLDNLATGKMENISELMALSGFTFINGDIRNLETCYKAVQGVDYVLHQAALGSVPHSIHNPVVTNEVNINGFLNMLVAARDARVKRFVYAASSSTYGDSKELPKVEEHIGQPMSPYAITKYVNELYASVFSRIYGMECIGLRYFNVFGKHQDPDSAYSAVIPLWVKQLVHGESPVINGDGSYSRDFTYIANVTEANERSILTPTEIIRERAKYYNLDLPPGQAINMVFNIALGGNVTLKALFETLRANLSKYNKEIASIEPIYGPTRLGDIPHSQASILKAQRVLGYAPRYDVARGVELACEWYWNHLK